MIREAKTCEKWSCDMKVIFRNEQLTGDKLFQQGEPERKMRNELVGHLMHGTRSNWWTNYK